MSHIFLCLQSLSNIGCILDIGNIMLWILDSVTVQQCRLFLFVYMTINMVGLTLKTLHLRWQLKSELTSFIFSWVSQQLPHIHLAKISAKIWTESIQRTCGILLGISPFWDLSLTFQKLWLPKFSLWFFIKYYRFSLRILGALHGRESPQFA